MEIKELKKVIYIELKGGDLVHALRQILSSVTFLKSEFINYQVDARIVLSGSVLAYFGLPDYIRLKKQLLPNGTIVIRTNIYSENTALWNTTT